MFLSVSSKGFCPVCKSQGLRLVYGACACLLLPQEHTAGV